MSAVQHLRFIPFPGLARAHRLASSTTPPGLPRWSNGFCATSPRIAEAAAEVSQIKSHKSGVTDPAKRAQLRAKLDGLIAHLYGLTESEFAHVLETFPLVPDPAKIAAQNAYRDAERGLLT